MIFFLPFVSSINWYIENNNKYLEYKFSGKLERTLRLLAINKDDNYSKLMTNNRLCAWDC